MLSKEQMLQALEKLEKNTSKKPRIMTKQTYEKLLKLSPKEQAELAIKEAEKRGYF